MKHISSRIIGYFLLYILILFTIFFLQFKKGSPLTYEAQHFRVSARYFINERNQRELLLPLYITSNGLLIFIAEQNPIKAMYEDGTIREIKISSYDIKNSSFYLFCENGIELHFSSNNEYLQNKMGEIDSFHITCKLSNKIKEVYLPYKLTNRARLEKQGNNILVQYDNKSFTFSKTQDGLIGQKDSSPFISFSKDSLSIYYHEHIAKENLELDNLLNGVLATKAQYEKNLNTFRNIALNALDKKIKTDKHLEQAFITLLAENGRRGLYQKAMITYLPNRPLKKDQTFLFSPFLGNIIELYEQKLVNDKERISHIHSKLKNKDLSIFEENQLLSFLFYRGEESLIVSIIDFIKNIDEKILSPLQASHILEFFIEYKNLYGIKEELLSLANKCETYLLSNLFAIKDKLYINTKENIVETLSTFYIANTLIHYGREQENELLESIGYILFNSLYSFSDNASSFPSFFVIRAEKNKTEGIMADDKTIIGTEMLYQTFFKDNTYLPHDKSLIKDNIMNIFAFTIAKDIKVNKKANSIVFEFSFDKGENHYAVLQGVPPFANIRIDEIIGYKTDPRFESYNAPGYVYIKEKKILYLKLKHNNEKEVIELFY